MKTGNNVANLSVQQTLGQKLVLQPQISEMIRISISQMPGVEYVFGFLCLVFLVLRILIIAFFFFPFFSLPFFFFFFFLPSTIGYLSKQHD